MSDWKRAAEARKKAEDDLDDEFCRVDADKKGRSNEEKIVGYIDCRIKLKAMSPAERNALLATQPSNSPSPPPSSIPSPEDPREVQLRNCRREAEKARNPKVRAEFMEWCLADVLPAVIPESAMPKSEHLPLSLSFEAPAGPFICNWVEEGKPCGDSFSTKGNLERHINTVHRKLKLFICNEVLDDGTVCGQSFTQEQGLIKHINTVHRKLKPLICSELLDDGTVCGQSFAEKWKLERHINTVHRKLKPFICNEVLDDGTVCGQTFTQDGNLKRHINLVHRHQKPTNDPFLCKEVLDDGTVCGQSFTEKGALKRHIDAVHRKLRPYICNEPFVEGRACGQTFFDKTHLDIHINAVHRKLKPFVCSRLLEDGTPCGQAFATKDSLNRHINIVHRQLKPFMCIEILEDGVPCGKRFSSRQNLKQHIDLVHRMLRPYLCTEPLENGQPCGQGFSTKPSLDRHIIVVHREVKPFPCTELLEDGTPCKKLFSTKVDLERHIGGYHSKSKFICAKCGRLFKIKKDLNRHDKDCKGMNYQVLKKSYHVKKGASVEDVIVGIIEQHCESLNIQTSRQKEFALGAVKIDLFCDGLEGKQVAVDVTTAVNKGNLVIKWAERRYQDYVDELWVIVCSNTWNSQRCADLTDEVHQDPQYKNVYIYYWTDLRNLKIMTIPPKIWKLLEIYEMCTLESKEECKKYWEEAKERFHTF